MRGRARRFAKSLIETIVGLSLIVLAIYAVWWLWEFHRAVLYGLIIIAAVLVITINRMEDV